VACLDDKRAHAFVSAEIAAADASLIEEHLDACPDCRRLVAALARHRHIELGATVSPELDATASPELGAPAPRRAGSQISRYQLLRKIGAGAMGTVWEAEDPQLDRRVAIKLLRTEGRDRLLREARAMAQLIHPNVVRVYDAGADEGEVFIAMELVEGRTLRDWLADTTPDWRQSAALAIEAGRGLEAAHEAGFVHRDFKPENVLVADDGRVLVGDFGLVWAGEHRGVEDPEAPVELTQTGALIGTPAYMAPEQLERHPDRRSVDPRADQFAFGVTLYEALWKRRPFAGSNLEELRAAVLDEAPAPPPAGPEPARLRRAVLRALSRDRGDRFDSMGDLLGELEAAVRPRRRRGAMWAGAGLVIGAAGAIAIVVAAGSDGGVECAGAGAMTEEWGALTQTVTAAGLLATGEPYAGATWATVKAAFDDYAERWSGQFDDACAATHERGEQSEELLDLRMQCLDRRRSELAALVDVFADADATVVAAAASGAGRLIDPAVCGDVDALRAAEPLPEDPETRARVEALRREVAVAKALFDGGRHADAESRAKSIADRVEATGYAPLRSELLGVIGLAQAQLGRLADAKKTFDESILAAEAGRSHRRRAIAMVQIVSVAAQSADYEWADEAYRRARAVIEGLGGDDELEATLLMYRGQSLLDRNRHAEAEEPLERSVELMEAVHGADDPALAGPLTGLGVAAAYGRRDLDRAVALMQRSLEIQQAALGESHPRLGKAHGNLGIMLKNAGRAKEALEHQEAAVKLFARSPGEGSHLHALTLGNLGVTYFELGELDEAEAAAREAAKHLARLFGEDHPAHANILGLLAGVLGDRGREAEALALHEKVLAVRLAIHGEDNVDTLAALNNVGMTLSKLERCDEALTYLERARAIGERVEVLPYFRFTTLVAMAQCHLDSGEPARAVALIERARPLFDGARTRDEKIQVASARVIFGRALVESGRDRGRGRAMIEAAAATLRELGQTGAADRAGRYLTESDR
jgi:tetratricopeptide (TPR) repeat protein/predicted Ser/Thr protein kinase